ncbi:MAG: hypothetical protein RLZZ124_1252 [Cyanobacteriota bacterium]|jgi:hypothetical protein
MIRALPPASIRFASPASRAARSLRIALVPVALLLVGGGLVGVEAQPSGLNFPQKGVVCDPAGRVCYDQQGISLGITREVYGPRAERDLLAQFANQPMPREYRLSDGSVCSVPARSCWSDGWSKRYLNQPLTTQLYGSSTQVLSKENGYCRLDDWGFRVYNGRCRLVRAAGNPDFQGTTYTVRMSNRSELVFGNRRGNLVARSGGRSWPAQFESLNRTTAVFRWGTQQLLVNTMSHGGSYGSSYGGTSAAPPLPSNTYNNPYRGSYSGDGVNWNSAIEGFLNGLFQ